MEKKVQFVLKLFCRNKNNTSPMQSFDLSQFICCNKIEDLNHFALQQTLRVPEIAFNRCLTFHTRRAETPTKSVDRSSLRFSKEATILLTP